MRPSPYVKFDRKDSACVPLHFNGAPTFVFGEFYESDLAV
jgi:hypothetical protein